MDSFKIKDRAVGAGAPCLLVGEVGQAHDGSLGMAHQFVELVAKSGFDAIKFQAHIASEESTLDEPFRIISHSQDATRYDYWKNSDFSHVLNSVIPLSGFASEITSKHKFPKIQFFEIFFTIFKKYFWGHRMPYKGGVGF